MMRSSLVSFASSDGKNTVAGYLYEPDEGVTVKGLVQLSHGMTDHVTRYESTAKVLTDAGFVFFGNDHLGHGATAAAPEDLGFFASVDGVGYVLDDLHAMTAQVKARYPDLPLVLLGHSMGSFLCRLYATRFGYELDGLIIMGTGGPNPLLPVGRALAGIIRRTRGERHRSRMIADMAFSGYLSHIEKGAPKCAWLSRDPAVWEVYTADPLCTFTFTVSAYLDLFEMVAESNAKTWFEAFPKELRTLVISGTEDPVGKFGQGPKYVADTLRAAGVRQVDLCLYEGARHELFNETNRDEFFSDLIAWLNAGLIAR
ncbi:MAG: alpha/beta fold hydrolase [Clostridia bacterium]|nr:alpha/beta fold hydrolase [Clostridia bacterium]